MIKMKIKGIADTKKKVKQQAFKEEVKGLKASSSKMLQHLKDKTPVDTGEARDSWELIDKNAGKRENSVPEFQVRNTADHIVALNMGHSKQAPSYFVEGVAVQYGRPIGAVVTIKDNPDR